MIAWLERLGIYGRAPDMRPRQEIEDDIRAEIAAHLALRAHDNEAGGMTPEEAARDARARFGDVDAIARTCRGVQMKERIMLQRINAVLIVVLLAGMAANLWAGASARDDMSRDVAGLRESVSALGTMLADARSTPASDARTSRLNAIDASALAIEMELVDCAAARLTAEHPKVAALRQKLDALGRERARLASEPATRSGIEGVYVMGKVSAAGLVPWREHLTLTKAIVLAGDFAEFAHRGKVAVVRDGDTGQTRIEVDVDEVVAGERPDVELRPGDLVFVPESFF